MTDRLYTSLALQQPIHMNIPN